MDYRIVLLLLTTGANSALAFYIITKDFRNKTNLFFGFMLLSIASWSFSLAAFYWVSTLSQVSITLIPIYASAALIAFFFNLFSIYFPHSDRRPQGVIIFLKFFVLFIILSVIFSTGIEKAMIFDTVHHDHETAINKYPYILFSLFFYFFIIESFINLGRKIRATTSYAKRILLIVFWSTMVAAIFGTIFNLMITLITWHYVWLGPLFTMIMVFVIVRYVFIKTPE